MFISNNLRNIISNNRIVSLITITITGFIFLVLFISYDYSRYLNDMEAILLEQETESQKMRINSELMELARSRTRITSKIIDLDDVFEQDELNLELENLANRFAQLRQSLLQQPLDSEEHKIIDSHNKIVPVILPAQRYSVELAMNQSADDSKKAKQIFYDVVLPGQGEMIISFGRLITIEQQRIANLSAQARSSMHTMKRRNQALMITILAFAIPISIFIILRIRKIQRALRLSHHKLRKSHSELEMKVDERTRELSNLNQHLQEVSENDALTKIYNRRRFNVFMQEEYDRTNRSGSDLSIIMIDIDFFKQFNDHYGHQEGDRCLTAVAAAMKACLPRSHDFIARYGGEEFVVVLPSTDLEGGRKVAEQIRQCIIDLAIPHECSSIVPHITISLGLTTYNAEQSSSIEDILREADEYLYIAKSKGRNTVAAAA